MNFSVLLSIYHKENSEYFKLALNSIWDDQILKPTEIVLVQDGFLGDELLSVISAFCDKAPVKLVKLQENVGLSKALNLGLKKCSYDLVARMDTDDIAESSRFLKQIDYYKNNPDTDVLGSYAMKIDEHGKQLNLLKVPTTKEKINKYIWTCPFIHPSVMFRKDKIVNIGSYNPNSGPRQDDYELWFRCAASGLSFANIPEPLLYYRFFADSVKKNNINVGWHRFKVGFKGCRKLNVSPIAYLGITIPFFRSLLPYPLNVYFNNFLEKINPRN